MIFCRYCGSQIPDDSAFCPRCGKPLGGAGGTEPKPENTGDARQNTADADRSRKKTEPGVPPGPHGPGRRGIPKPLAAAVCVLALVVAGWAIRGAMTSRRDPGDTIDRFRETMTGNGIGETDEDDGSGEIIRIPDPGPFFGVEPDSVEDTGDGQVLTYTMSLNHTIIDEYLEVLAIHYGLEPGDTQKSVSEYRYSFDIPLEVKVEYNHPRSNMVLTLTCGGNIRLEDSGVESSKPGRKETGSKDTASGGSSGAPASSSSGGAKTPAKSDLTVPDPGSFLNCSRDTGAGECCFSVDDIKGPAAAEEYRKLLESWNFKEVYAGKREYAKNGIDRFNEYDYYYDYTGSGKVTGEVDWFSPDKKEADLYLSVKHYVNEDRILLSLRMKDCFTLADPGVTASDPPADRNNTAGSGGGSGSGGSSDDDESRDPGTPKIKCTKCHGEGTVKCSQCDGEGGKYITDNSTPNYAGSLSGPKVGKTWEKCRKCDGTGSMTCPRCHGEKVQ